MTTSKPKKTISQPVWFKANLLPKPTTVSVSNDGSNKYQLYTIMLPTRLNSMQQVH